MTMAIVQILTARRYSSSAGNYSQRFEQAHFALQDICPAQRRRLNRVGQIITAGASLGLPAFDGAAKARVRRRAAPALMMFFALPFEHHEHAGRIILAAENQPAFAAGQFYFLDRLLVHFDVFAAPLRWNGLEPDFVSHCHFLVPPVSIWR